MTDATIDGRAIGALITGGVGAQLALCLFLIEEGIIDRARLVAYLERQIARLDGAADDRALLTMRRLVSGLRDGGADVLLN